MTVPLVTLSGFAPGLCVAHGFTSRAGGSAQAPFDTLPLAQVDGVGDEVLVSHWDGVARALHPSLSAHQVALIHQVHGDVVRIVGAGQGPLNPHGAADALVVAVPYVAVAVRVADCVPVLLATQGGVAAVHAGWRGVAAGIVGKAVAVLCEVTGTEASMVHAVIGPHIHTDAYEVGREVIDGIVASGVPESVAGRRGAGDRWHARLGASVDHQLMEAGVAHTGDVQRCTSDPAFYSYRHDGPVTGRQAGVIAWCP